MKAYIFEDWNGGEILVFTSAEKRKEFFKQYVHKMIDLNAEPPHEKEDYSMREAEIDPNFNKWWNS